MGVGPLVPVDEVYTVELLPDLPFALTFFFVPSGLVTVTDGMSLPLGPTRFVTTGEATCPRTGRARGTGIWIVGLSGAAAGGAGGAGGMYLGIPGSWEKLVSPIICAIL